MTEKTIYALSTTYGKSGIAVIRISGSSALKVVEQMTDLDIKNLKSRHAYFTQLKDIVSRETLDNILLLYFKNPASFTGEEVVELHIHGSKAVISSVLDNLSKIENFRIAEAGEFSKRAFYNNKMDLTEAEGLADLIDAETSEQQKYAVRQMEGSLKNLYDGWRQNIIKILAYLEAYIDFPDEDIPNSLAEAIMNDVFKLKTDIINHLKNGSIGERLREGFRTVIIGPPNAGKSSLLNAVIDREAAIVSDIAGTTRDAIDIHLDIKGYPLTVTDTAGIRESKDFIEKKGMDIAIAKIKNADLVLCLFDASKDDISVFKSLQNSFKNKEIYVANKSDKLTFKQCSRLEKQGIIVISSKHKKGLDKLMDAIYESIKEKFTSNSGLLITRSRYKEALNEAVSGLERFNLNKEIELSAEDIRLAARSIGKITGHIEVNDILNKIFSSFCIGK